MQYLASSSPRKPISLGSGPDSSGDGAALSSPQAARAEAVTAALPEVLLAATVSQLAATLTAVAVPFSLVDADAVPEADAPVAVPFSLVDADAVAEAVALLEAPSLGTGLLSLACCMRRRAFLSPKPFATSPFTPCGDSNERETKRSTNNGAQLGLAIILYKNVTGRRSAFYEKTPSQRSWRGR